MTYVEVLVADIGYRKADPLTYSSAQPLRTGQVVAVNVKHKQVLAIVQRTVPQPKFATKAVTTVADLPPLPSPLLGLLAWMIPYYPAPLGSVVSLLLPVALPKQTAAGERLHKLTVADLPPLTSEQRAVLEAVGAQGTHLLHGDTGSGKTRVYLELTQRALAAGKSAIILTPEIGLTSQLAQTFRSVLGERVAVLHSGLTAAARRELWGELLRSAEPRVVIGARSALFSPLADVGLIVVDEAHEPAYKQDQAPYYQTSSVAAKLATLHKAPLILGSATPSVADYFVATSKQRPILRMTKPAAGKADTPPANVTVVDLRERQSFAKSPHLSTQLITAMRQALDKGEQTLLFLNRRGTARVILCQACGWQARCPHCDTPLVYHGDLHELRCHSCAFKTRSPLSCPECRNTDILFRSVGTKAIVEEVARLFPEARVMRFDTDNKKDERLEAQYDTVRSGQVDVIVGTQTIAKGLDLPRLGLVGVVLADSGLSFPDFSARERSYQLLTQVLGRVGRGHRKGQAVLQTYAPASSFIASVLSKNWNEFYNNELAERRQFIFPPFCYLLKLSCKRASSASAQKSAQMLAKQLQSHNYNVVIEGPTPTFQEKLQGKFVWQIIVKAKARSNLTAIITQLPSGWSYDIDPLHLL